MIYYLEASRTKRRRAYLRKAWRYIITFCTFFWLFVVYLAYIAVFGD